MPITESGYTEIGDFDAQTRLSEILRKVELGERFTITVQGRAVADVVPSQGKDRQRVVEAVRRLRAMPKIEGISPETVKAWIEEGRP